MLFRPTLTLLNKLTPNLKMTNYSITITSDIICPWCYIGHTRLSKAITNHKTTYPDDTFTLKYLPFYLNPPAHLTSTTNTKPAPSFPVTSRPRREMYAEKFGASRATQIESTMAQVSAGEGLSFKFGGNTGPSRNGHRLVHYAQTHGGEQAQNDVMLGLWRRYFEQEVDVTTLEVLVDVGVEAGLGGREEVKAFLEGSGGGEEVDSLAESAREDGVSGVPYYVVQGQWAVSGAQEPRAFEMLFERYKKLQGDAEVKVGRGEGCL